MGVTGRQIMTAFELFITDEQDMTGKPYGATMAAFPRAAFPC